MWSGDIFICGINFLRSQIPIYIYTRLIVNKYIYLHSYREANMLPFFLKYCPNNCNCPALSSLPFHTQPINKILPVQSIKRYRYIATWRLEKFLARYERARVIADKLSLLLLFFTLLFLLTIHFALPFLFQRYEIYIYIL